MLDLVAVHPGPVLEVEGAGDRIPWASWRCAGWCWRWIPVVGITNWLLIPFATIGAIMAAIGLVFTRSERNGRAKAGLVLNALVILAATWRLGSVVACCERPGREVVAGRRSRYTRLAAAAARQWHRNRQRRADRRRSKGIKTMSGTIKHGCLLAAGIAIAAPAVHVRRKPMNVLQKKAAADAMAREYSCAAGCQGHRRQVGPGDPIVWSLFIVL